MPVAERTYPYRVPLLHDVSAWQRDIMANCNRPLGMYPPADFNVTEPSYPYPAGARKMVTASMRKSEARLEAVPHT